MKKSVLNGIVAVVLGLLSAQIGRAQGTTFLSNLGQTPDGSNPVGSNSWLAAGFDTGSNPGGYVLNSVQLGMGNSTGNPGGFTVMIYAEGHIPGAVNPSVSIGTLVGNSDPTTAGTYTYTSPAGIMLSPGTDYYLVVTAGTATANGAFAWNFMNSYSYDSSGGLLGVVTSSSSTGSLPSWTRLGGNPSYDFSQFALNATAAPEPGTLGLLALGGLVFGLRRWNEKKRSRS